jgi:hypothetical protein
MSDPMIREASTSPSAAGGGVVTVRSSVGSVVFDASAAQYGPMIATLYLPLAFGCISLSIVKETYLGVHFWYPKAASSLVQGGGKSHYSPSVPCLLLVWGQGDFDGDPGAFLQSLVMKGRTYLVFDRTNYSNSGEVL